jgi:hypothetical protein
MLPKSGPSEDKVLHKLTQEEFQEQNNDLGNNKKKFFWIWNKKWYFFLTKNVDDLVLQFKAMKQAGMVDKESTITEEDLGNYAFK